MADDTKIFTFLIIINNNKFIISAQGLMEFAGVDKAARSKMGVWKMQEWTMRHHVAGVDNAGVDNAGVVKCL